MGRRNDPWAGVNKCVVCGTKLKFRKSDRKDAKSEEGERYCEQSHMRFGVYGKYDDDDNSWYLTFKMPLGMGK